MWSLFRVGRGGGRSGKACIVVRPSRHHGSIWARSALNEPLHLIKDRVKDPEDQHAPIANGADRHVPNSITNFHSLEARSDLEQPRKAAVFHDEPGLLMGNGRYRTMEGCSLWHWMKRYIIKATLVQIPNPVEGGGKGA